MLGRTEARYKHVNLWRKFEPKLDKLIIIRRVQNVLIEYTVEPR